MFKRNVLAVSMTLAALCSAQAAFADVNGGGATSASAAVPDLLAYSPPASPLTSAWAAAKAKRRSSTTTTAKFGTGTKNVHWAGSDSKLTAA